MFWKNSRLQDVFCGEWPNEIKLMESRLYLEALVNDEDEKDI